MAKALHIKVYALDTASSVVKVVESFAGVLLLVVLLLCRGG